MALSGIAVAQISDLPYRSASSLRAVDPSKALNAICRLEIGDTAGLKPALRWSGRPGDPGTVKKKKKKVALPRRQWQINPVTRVKPSARTYSRSRAKSETRDESEQ